MPLLHGALSVALAITVVAVAYGVGAPSLGVAEFSPSAQTELSTPPTTDGSQAGGAAPRSRRSTTTTAPPQSSTPGATETTTVGPTSLKARGRPCYGNPPRQTEDPMAPPCVPTIFEGDNGGATSKGVSATEIRIAMPAPNTTTGYYNSPAFAAAMDGLIDYINRSFEFYGRRIVPQWVQTSGYANGPVPSRARAVEIAANDVFGAVTALWEIGGSGIEAGFVQELARQGVVSVTRNGNLGWSDEAVYDFAHPYAWSVYPSAEDRQRNFADFACTSLAGKPAQHAGAPALKEKTRKFGILSLGYVVPPSVKTLSRGLMDCTGEAPVLASTKATNADARIALESLRQQGVTTLFCACPGYSVVDYAIPEAGNISYFPEWVIEPGTGSEYYPQWLYAQGKFGTSGPISLNMGPRLMPLQSRLWYRVISSVGAGLVSGTNLGAVFFGAEQLYDSMLLLAAGIQGAGPNLTAETFAQGLMSMQFPNTGAGAAPYWQPSAGFGPGDHSFYDDYNVAFWDPTLPATDASTYSPTGSWCYLGAGARFKAGSYPKDVDNRLFNPSEPCR